MEYLNLKYPKLVEVITIGHSYEGQPIKMVKISNGRNKKNGSKSAVWIDAGEFRFSCYVPHRKNLFTSRKKKERGRRRIREKLYRHSYVVQIFFESWRIWSLTTRKRLLYYYSRWLFRGFMFKRRYILRIINVEILPRDCTHEAISSLEFISFLKEMIVSCVRLKFQDQEDRILGS